MTTWFDLGLSTRDIIAANHMELETLIDHAINDMVTDTFNQFKDISKPRKITVEIELSRVDEQIGANWKVTPKAAPYEKIPEKEKVPEGQISLLDVDENGGIKE